MKKMDLRLIILSAIFLFMLSGCGLKFTITEPVPSKTFYSASIEPTVLTIVDDRKGMDAIFLLGKLGAGAEMKETDLIKLDNIENPMAYFAEQLEKEFQSRRMPVKCVIGANKNEKLTLVVNRYQIANIRATGFSPWESLHIFSGTLIRNNQKTVIKSYFYNGKVPVWSMNEILEPCFNIPISIMVKDIASKINKAAFNLRVSDKDVQALVAQIQAQTAKQDFSDFWKVLELGYTNSPQAVAPLKNFAQISDEFYRSCAISSIGTLQATGEIDFLKNRYRQGTYNDRYMAAKAIGDLGTPEAGKALEAMKSDAAYEKEGGLKYCVDLYLQ